MKRQASRVGAICVCTLTISAHVMFTDVLAASQPGSWQQLSLVPGSATTQVVSVAQIKTVDGSTSWVIGGATAASPPARRVGK